jgi:hypothetical protein
LPSVDDWVLAVDIGTINTVAAVAEARAIKRVIVGRVGRAVCSLCAPGWEGPLMWMTMCGSRFTGRRSCFLDGGHRFWCSRIRPAW